MKIRRLLASIMAAMMILTVFPQDFYVFAAQTEDTALVEETVDTQTVEDGVSEESADEAVTDDSDKEVSDETADIEAEETDKDTEDSSDTVSENSTDEKTVSGNDANEDVADLGNVGEEVLMYGDVSDMLYQNGALSISEDALGTKLGTQKYREVCDFLYKELLQKKTSIDISKYKISTSDIKNVYFGTINEHGDLYFARDGRFQYYLDGNNVTKIEPLYPGGTFDDEAFKKAVDRALQVIEPGMTDLEKALALHDYIDVNTVYQIGASNQYNTYGILVGQSGVCNGYALTYKYLLSLVGIESVFITSEQLNHAWNAIEIDGKYYLVDVTWDDPTYDRLGRTRHEFFIQSETRFRSGKPGARQTHQASDWEIIVDGEKVTDLNATDTTYDSYFWDSVDAPFVFDGRTCFYINDNTKCIVKGDLNGNTDNSFRCSLGSWSNWQGAFSGLWKGGSKLYFNKADGIYCVDINGNGGNAEKKWNPAEKTSSNSVYGSQYVYWAAQDKDVVRYVMNSSPNMPTNPSIYYITPDKIGMNQAETKPVAPDFYFESDEDYKDLDDGSVLVDSGTEVSPESETSGATVYYTTDGSDPVVGNANTIRFDATEPIVITQDVTIKAIAKGNKEVSEVSELTIKVANNSLTLDKTNETIDIDETLQLTVTKPDYPKSDTITWSSRNPSVATVQDGLVTPVDKGNVNIIASGYDWKGRSVSATCSVTITATEYTVKFIGFKGAVLDTQTVIKGRAATAPQLRAPLGYTFDGWDKEFDNVTSDLEVNAKFTPIEYSITYDTKGGTLPAGALQKYTIETETYTLPTPTRNEYKFEGWFIEDTTAPSGYSKITKINKGSTGNVSVEAHWTYDVEYKVPDKPVLSVADTSNKKVLSDGSWLVDKDTEIFATTTETGVDIYYTTDGTDPVVNEGTTQKYTAPIKITGDSTLKVIAMGKHYASEIVSKTVKVASNILVFEKDTDSVIVGDTIDITVKSYPTETALTDITWSSENDAIAKVDTKGTVTGVAAGSTTIKAVTKDWLNREVKAECTVVVNPLPTYTVRFYGLNNKLLDTQQVVHRKSATAPELGEITGYTFEKWDKEFASVTSDMDIHAVLKPILYTITYDTAGGTLPDDAPGSYTIEDEVTLPEAAKDEQIFGGWFIKNSENKIDKIEKGTTGDIELVAKWVQDPDYLVPDKPEPADKDGENHKVTADGSWLVDENGEISFTIADGTEIYYTIDGSEPVANGETTIKYTGPIKITKDTTLKFFVKGKKKNSEVFTQEIKVASNVITLKNDKLEIKEDDSVQIEIDKYPSEFVAGDLSWSSDKPDIATVDENGKVTGIFGGTANITVTTHDWKNREIKAVCEVTVKAAARTAEVKADPACDDPVNGINVEKGTKVILTSDTVGAKIYYTTDENDDPIIGADGKAQGSTKLYTDAITVNESMVINAIAVCEGHKNSQKKVFRYNVTQSWGDVDPELQKTDGVFGGDATKVPDGLWYVVSKEVAKQSKATDVVKTYTGAKITFNDEIEVYDGTRKLWENRDYTLTFKNNQNVASKNAGAKSPTITIKGKGNYTKTAVFTFTIAQADLNSAVLTSERVLAVNTGTKLGSIKPVFMYEGKKLALGKDFAVSYLNGNANTVIAAGERYRITLTGKGSFTNEYKDSILVMGLDPKAPDITSMSRVKVNMPKAKDLPYSTNGYAVETLFDNSNGKVAKATVMNGKVALEYGKDFTVYSPDADAAGKITDAGKHTVFVYGIGAYAGEKAAVLEISGIPANKVKITGLPTAVEYTGKAYELPAGVKLFAPDGTKLVPKNDYDADIHDGGATGKVNITFTFKGRYTGIVKKTVNVKARSIAVAVIDIKGSAKYSKAGAVPEAVSVKLGGETLIEGIDYTLSYKNNTKSGVTAVVTAKGIGNYTGTVSKGFRVEKSLITDCVTLVSADKQFNAKAKAGYFKSVPKLMDGGKAISIGKDVNKFDTKTAFKYYYAASTEEIPDAAVVPANTLIKVKVMVTCGPASPYQAGTYELVGYYKMLDKGKDLKAAKVKINNINNLTFNNGKPVVPLKSEDLTVTVGKENLDPKDYDIISVKNNRFLGTATVVIQGKGTYGGTKSFTFKIGAKAFK